MGILGSLLIALFAGLLSMEIGDRYQQLVVWLVKTSTRFLPFSARRRARYCEEWTADALASSGRLTAILRATGTFQAVVALRASERGGKSRQKPASRIGQILSTLLILDRPINLRLIGGIQVVISRPYSAASRKFRLTNREYDCLLWTARGKTAWEVGQILGISEETTLFHLKNACRKLGVFSKHHACVRAIVQGLILP